jgi:hypothetical protein
MRKLNNKDLLLEYKAAVQSGTPLLEEMAAEELLKRLRLYEQLMQQVGAAITKQFGRGQ